MKIKNIISLDYRKMGVITDFDPGDWLLGLRVGFDTTVVIVTTLPLPAVEVTVTVTMGGAVVTTWPCPLVDVTN